MLTFNFSPFPTLYTERLVLRQVIPDDVNEVFHFRSHPSMMEFIQRNAASNLDEAHEWIRRIGMSLQNNEGITWGMCLKNEPRKLIGTVAFWHTIPEHHRAEVGYQLHAGHRGKGFMDEALKAILVYGFEQMKLHSVMANVDPRNQASINLLERNGFVREGYFKEDYFFDGHFYDSAVYSLLNPNR